MIVMDCSALVEIVRGTDLGRRYRHLILTGEEVIAPELICAELVSAFLKYVRAGRTDLTQARESVHEAENYIDRYCQLADLQDEVMAESLRLKHSSYDLFYLVLARRNAATLFTADRKLADLARKVGVDCTMQLDVEGDEWTLRLETEDLRGRGDA